MYINTYIFYFCTWRWPRCIGTLGTINTHSVSFGFQILLSTKTHLASSENGWLQGRQGKYRTDLEHFLVPESKEMLKVCWRNFKKDKEPVCRGSHWSNLRVLCRPRSKDSHLPRMIWLLLPLNVHLVYFKHQNKWW